MNAKGIAFIPMNSNHIGLWDKWVEIPHVKEVWFIDGYETTNYINKKIKGNGYDYPFIIYIDDLPIGYIQGCDLYAYRTKCENPKGLFKTEKKDTWGMDLFIADGDYLNKGYGTQIVRLFVKKLFKEFGANDILIDPAVDNKRAIRCYEKSGFTFERQAHDGVTYCVVMKITKNKSVEPEIKIREANIADLSEIIYLLADDTLGSAREDITMPPCQSYINAIIQIIGSDNAELLVVEINENIIGVAQINYLRYLTYQGGLRAQIEGVRVHKKYQGKGVGKFLFQNLILRAKNKNCHLIQLTTDKSRPDALKFYEKLGFELSHIGLKLHLKKAQSLIA